MTKRIPHEARTGSSTNRNFSGKSERELICFLWGAILCNVQINYNLPDYDESLTYRALYDYVNAHYVAGKFFSFQNYPNNYRTMIKSADIGKSL